MSTTIQCRYQMIVDGEFEPDLCQCRRDDALTLGHQLIRDGRAEEVEIYDVMAKPGNPQMWIWTPKGWRTTARRP